MKYYLDTAIYLDYHFNRSDNFRPLGEWAFQLLTLIRSNSDVLIISEFVINELKTQLSEQEIGRILNSFAEVMEFVSCDDEQFAEALVLKRKLKIPSGDIFHAILARDNGAILVTRDKHFEQLRYIVEVKKPEELI
ncbi:PIN domain-containing protein [Candidatus Woesearchaeota archaeon]|nr:PIN domain-containing protein [Candidatus Woesearchaeota archaeon]